MPDPVTLTRRSAKITTPTHDVYESKYILSYLQRCDLHLVPVNFESLLAWAVQINPLNDGTFATAVNFLAAYTDEDLQEELTKPLDALGLTDASSRVYQGEGPTSVSATLIGQAAAIQALDTTANEADARSINNLVSSAMDLAFKKFDEGPALSGNKQDAVNSAAFTALHLCAAFPRREEGVA
ncbi:hypothetical protein DXG01_010818 [Tephrocybe rancida]|nr:hypothetical protein DXG01_010818 [Tephrocybe rancida]